MPCEATGLCSEDGDGDVPALVPVSEVVQFPGFLLPWPPCPLQVGNCRLKAWPIFCADGGDC